MKKGGHAPVAAPRRGKKAARGSTFWWIALGLAVALVTVAVYLVMQPKKSVTLQDTQRPATGGASTAAPEKKTPVEFESWEAEFDSTLWQGTIPEQLKSPPYLLTSGGALVKEVADLKAAKGRKFRVLMFDQSGEVQGVVAFDAASNEPRFQEIALEYVQTMAVASMFSPALTCDGTGHALVLGLGAGSVANLLHTTLRNLHVDVVEVSEDVRRAAQEYLGSAVDGPRFRLLMQDALTVFETVPSERRYELIVFDAYMPGPAIPPPLATREYIQKMSDHLAPEGVLVLNFCLPFYSLEEQLRVMQVYREVFRHLHVLESTPTSKIVVAYNWEPRREHEAVAAQLDTATAECGWPAVRRGFHYHTYLPRDEGWRAEWGRAMHQEASEYFCASGQLPRAYCSWFTPRHELAKAVPVAYFGSMEQEMALRKAKNDWRRAIPIARKQGKLT
jgi:spermidine synthase